MKQGWYEIRENCGVAPRVYRLRLAGDTSGMVRGGQFVDIALDGFFLRRPFGVASWDAGEMTLYYKVVGEGTRMMARLRPGVRLDVLTGLGNGFDAACCLREALLVGGGLGASPMLPLARELAGQGKRVVAVLGFNRAADIVLAEEYRALGADVCVVTLDGSAGWRGTVCDALRKRQPAYDYFYTCGPKVMMQAVCDMLDGPGEASLEERMGCGCGICCGCTCRTAKGAKAVCSDGPVFKKEDIVW